jgi:RNA polymerase sigma factor (sigma-70 family)
LRVKDDPIRGIDMDVRLKEAQQSYAQQTNGRGLEPEQIARILGENRKRELSIARGFSECRGLDPYQLEDLYQETTLALLHRPYRDEKHLRDALRKGIKRRALNLYRDERRHLEILAENAPGLYALQSARSSESDPQQIALARQDRLIITEFLAELSSEERRVFWLLTEGMKYNRIAKILGIAANQARSTVAVCERKRERFQLLYDSGRLCGYRSSTITALLQGQATSQELARLALAHVQSCAHCRAEHHTNAKRLRRAFQDQAAALLPPLLLQQTLGHLARTSINARTLLQRLQPGWGSLAPGGGLRERALALLAGSGATAKLTTGLVTIAVLAGGALTATHALEHHHAPAARPSTTPAASVARTSAPMDFAMPAPAPPLSPQRYLRPAATTASTPLNGPGRVVANPHTTTGRPAQRRREPGGFAYLGVPTSTPTPPSAPAPVSPAVQQPPETARQTGGPFSP